MPTADGSDRRIDPKVTRRGILGVAGASLLAGCTSTDDDQSVGGVGSSWLILDAGETFELAGIESYDGVQWQDGGTLRWTDGSGVRFN